MQWMLIRLVVMSLLALVQISVLSRSWRQISHGYLTSHHGFVSHCMVNLVAPNGCLPGSLLIERLLQGHVVSVESICLHLFSRQNLLESLLRFKSIVLSSSGDGIWSD